MFVRWARALVAAVVAVVLVIAVGLAGLITVAPGAAAQALVVDLIESPFVCDGGTRRLGTVRGLTPGEPVIFTSPQLNGVFSERTADEAGEIPMRWTCDSVTTWEVTVTGLTSGRSTSFTLSSVPGDPAAPAPLGAAFDARSAMTIEQMAIWKDFSPYNGVGIYLPVDERWDNRADKEQSNLTPAWVEAVLTDGWRIIPIYVGPQAPASCAIGRFVNMAEDVASAKSQGLAVAADAALSMAALGFKPGDPIYYDLEGYRAGACSEAVLAFVDGWVEGVRSAGFVAGLYGSQDSVMADVSGAVGRSGFDAPDAVWVSTNSKRPTTFGLDHPPDNLWSDARIHQYQLSVTRTYGGVTREVDDNIVAGPVAILSRDADGDGHDEPEPDNCDGRPNPDQSDIDGDGDGDVCDVDIDGDGIVNEVDNCVLIANPDQADSRGAGQGDACSDDDDADGVADTDDNCTAVANADQADLDGDGIGDACDDDLDGDGATNEPDVDNCDAVANPDQADLDGDGDGDVCDDDLDGDGLSNPEPDNCDRAPNPDQADLDGDGDGDVCDVDIDGDGVANEDDPAPLDPTAAASPVATTTPLPLATPTAEVEAQATVTPLPVFEATPTAEPSESGATGFEGASPTATAVPDERAAVRILNEETPLSWPRVLFAGLLVLAGAAVAGAGWRNLGRR